MERIVFEVSQCSTNGVKTYRGGVSGCSENLCSLVELNLGRIELVIFVWQDRVRLLLVLKCVMIGFVVPSIG